MTHSRLKMAVLSAATTAMVAAAVAWAMAQDATPPAATPPATAPTTPAPAAPRKLALLVAVAGYGKPYVTRQDPTGWPPLHTYLDTHNMAQVLVEKWGFKANDILVLNDLQTFRGGKLVPGPGATRQGILEALRQLVAQARPGDAVVFMFSGHGQQVRDDLPDADGKIDRDEQDGLDESFVPYDYITSRAADGAKSNIRDDDLQRMLSALTAKMRGPDGKVQGNITVIMDSCHSGTIARGNQIAKGRGWDIELDGPLPPTTGSPTGSPTGAAKGDLAEGQANPDGSGLLQPGEALARGYVLFSACQSHESAYEVEDDKDKPLGGALVYNFCKALRAASPAAPPTYRDVFERVQAEIKASFPTQTPALEGEVDQLMFSGVARPAPFYPLVESYDGGVVTIAAGQLHGVTEKSRYELYKAGSDPEDATNKPLVEVTINQVEAFRCTATVPSAQRKGLTPEALRGAKAVLTAQYFGDQKLRVLLAGTDRLGPALKEPGVPDTEDALQLIPAPAPTPALASPNAPLAKGAPPQGQSYDVRIALETLPGVAKGAPGEGAPQPQSQPLLVVRRNDNTLVGVVPDDATAGARLRTMLLGAWRWRYLNLLGTAPGNGNAALQVTMRIVPVEVEEIQQGGRTVKRVKGDRRDVKPTAGNQLVLHQGDYFRLEVENKGPATVWVTILDLQPDGSIAPLFPHPKAPSVVENRVPGGTPQQPTRLRVPGTFDVRAPFGADVFKLIATPEPVNFTPLLFQAEKLPDGVRGPAEDKARDALQKAKGPASPLARLLLAASTGRRGVGTVNAVEPAYWGTATATLETRDK